MGGCLVLLVACFLTFCVTFAIAEQVMSVTAEQIVAASVGCGQAKSTVRSVTVYGDFQCMNGMKGDRPK